MESSGCYTILNIYPTSPIYRILLKFKKGNINSETMRSMRYLHPRWHQLYGKPKSHKLKNPIRPVVSFYNTPLSALHKVLAHYLKFLSKQLHPPQRTNDFKQHLNTTGHPNFPYHNSLENTALVPTPTRPVTRGS